VAAHSQSAVHSLITVSGWIRRPPKTEATAGFCPLGFVVGDRHRPSASTRGEAIRRDGQRARKGQPAVPPYDLISGTCGAALSRRCPVSRGSSETSIANL